MGLLILNFLKDYKTLHEDLFLVEIYLSLLQGICFCATAGRVGWVKLKGHVVKLTFNSVCFVKYLVTDDKQVKYLTFDLYTH